MQKKFSYPLKIEDLNQNEYKFDINADVQELNDIKEILKVESVKYFNAEIYLKRQNKQNLLFVWGIVRTEIELKSVISLNNFLKYYEVPFEMKFDLITFLSYAMSKAAAIIANIFLITVCE